MPYPQKLTRPLHTVMKINECGKKYLKTFLNYKILRAIIFIWPRSKKTTKKKKHERLNKI